MTFYSLTFALFLILLWGASRWTKGPLRQWVFLLASYFFYWTWSRWFLLLLIAVSLFDYLWGEVLKRRQGRAVLWAGVLVNLSILIFCKSVFLSAGAAPWMSDAGLLVPVGISFFSFQGISYLIDVYRGFEGAGAPRSFLLYMAFWPTVLAGPICRAPEMLPQFASREIAPLSQSVQGLQRIIAGLFLKLVLAETLWQGILPGQGLKQGLTLPPASLGMPDVLLLSFGLGLWLYFDFSGYTHIACGTAQMLGIQLRENFRFPYHSLTPQEFWTRWHMSLSSWIRDYVFFPLSTLRRGHSWRYFALFLSLVIFGLWHGATLNFLLWGAYQGAILMLWRRFGPDQRTLRQGHRSNLAPRFLSWAVSLLLITLGWIIFFVPVGRAATLLSGLLRYSDAGIFRWEFCLLIGTLWLGHLALGLLKHPDGGEERGSWPIWAERYLPGPACVIMFLLILALGGNQSPFAYVRF